MNKSAWALRTDMESVSRRAAGRRRINATRQARAILRQVEVCKRLRLTGFARGSQAAIARALGVSPATVSRDVGAILKRLSRQAKWREDMALGVEFDVATTAEHDQEED